MSESAQSVLRFVIWIAVVVGIVAGVLFGFFVRIVPVAHNAMAPSIFAGDEVLVWKGDEFDLGDIVVCRHPRVQNRFVISRLVARAGHTVAISQGELKINGHAAETQGEGSIEFTATELQGQRFSGHVIREKILDHNHLALVDESTRSTELRETPVRTGVFVLSDNRAYFGEDSRGFGVVDPSGCIGTVFMRWTTGPDSPDDFGNSALDLIR